MNHVMVVDLGYGDAGKGTVVDALCAARPVHTVVRFNGGAQAAHNVVLRDGRAHTFAQFGAGTFRPGVRTHLARQVVVDPLALAAEADHLASVGVPDAFERLTVDGEALLATPYHRAANRAREIARGADRHGTCGLGVGEAVAYGLAHPAELGPLDAPPVDDCLPAYAAFADRVAIVDRSWLAGALRAGTCVFEGAQGVLLDEWHGFHPYTTWSTTTFANAETLLAEAGMAGAAQRLGVLRVTTTRHGPGPLVTEDPTLPFTDPRNPTNAWQGRFRFGHFDAVAHRYALEVAGGVDGLALTHLDLAGPELRICRRYADGLDRLVPGPAGDLERQAALTDRLMRARPVLDEVPSDWATTVEEALGVPVVLTSHGPRAEEKEGPLVNAFCLGRGPA
ncbi:adenylosuccinate synthetase [Micromonospora sp. NBS 11-29]|uniref:adenylosuccinate synthetase n=1 Tax=Micromonospora sp. NBS 11-29 TaxID=1960879 RepID=UPI000B78E32E|nr:adenylosuccinate synthetase [Micromonospora sp. NBS 11-29]